MDYQALISNLIILVVIIIVYFYQKKRIESLRETVDSQKDILDSAKKLNELYNVDDYKKYVELHKEKNEMEAEKLITEMKKEFAESYNANLNATIEQYQKIVSDLAGLVFSIFITIHPNKRHEILNEYEFDSDYAKRIAEKIIDNSREIYYPLLYSGNIINDIFVDKKMD